MPKYPRYQDYVIRDGKLIGEFEEMYRDFEDPWEQTTHERFTSKKAVALNLLTRLKHENAVRTVIELGCGFGHFTARMAETGLKAVGVDISKTAIAKAKERHANADFVVGEISDHELIKRLSPDVIVMAEISWYVLDHLPAFIAFLRRERPDIWLLHLLTTYAPGVQKYGRDFFTNLDEIKSYFDFAYLESGLVNYPHGEARTWFLGKPKPRA